MGSSELRDSFNSVTEPNFIATMALLDYVREHDTEWQVLWFRGTAADGAPFDIKSDPLRAGTDLNMEAKAVAHRLLAQQGTPVP